MKNKSRTSCFVVIVEHTLDLICIWYPGVVRFKPYCRRIPSSLPHHHYLHHNHHHLCDTIIIGKRGGKTIGRQQVSLSRVGREWINDPELQEMVSLTNVKTWEIGCKEVLGGNRGLVKSGGEGLAGCGKRLQH